MTVYSPDKDGLEDSVRLHIGTGLPKNSFKSGSSMLARKMGLNIMYW